MQKTLFLMMGYPGAGKTTTATIIASVSGASHLWADNIRRQSFTSPTYSHAENQILYDQMNHQAEELLVAGKSVVYDTNFSYYKDRKILRAMALQHNARTLLIWVQVPKKIARQRATQQAHKQDTRVLGDMSIQNFERLSSCIELPKAHEQVIDIDGTIVTEDYIRDKLQLVM